jgi:hypothetical protein
MLSYLTNFWSNEPNATDATIPNAELKTEETIDPTNQPRSCCWVVRGGADQHSGKCHEPINGLVGVFDTLEAAQREAGWLALFSGCVHLRLGRVPLNQIAIGKPVEVLCLRELRFEAEATSFRAIFVQDSIDKPQVAGPICEVRLLEAWMTQNGFDGEPAAQRVAAIKQVLDKDPNSQHWTFGANDQLLHPIARTKVKAE